MLDIGASTGGFTDCVLQHGAKSVVAIELGRNQLHWSLKNNPKVTSIEQTDIRIYQAKHGERFDWIVADISFNAA